MKIPKTIYAVKSNIMFIAGLVIFVLFFAITYTPNYGLTVSILNSGRTSDESILLWYSHQGLCLPLCCAIILVTTTLSRTLLLLTTHTARLREGDYLLWQAGEVTASSLFVNLFLTLYLHLDYFESLPVVLLIYISVAIYPYAFYWLLVERIDRDRRIADAQRTIVRLRQRESQADSGMLRFSDDKGNTKLVVSTESVISIEAAGNYVTSLYVSSSGKLMRYSLRNTLKGIEGLCSGSPLARCHRSYFLNLNKVKLLRKASDGVYAEIDFEGVNDIPVSKSYAADVMARLSEPKK